MDTKKIEKPVTDVISQLRFPLIVLVVYAHHYSGVSSDYSVLSLGWDLYACCRILIGQTLVKVAMPLFFMFSGYLFFLNVENLTTEAYYRKLRRRAKTLLLPYLLWNAVVAAKAVVEGRMEVGELSPSLFWNFYHTAGRQIDWLGNVNTMSAPIDMPLWFLRDLMVVTLLSPVIYLMVRRWGNAVLVLLTVIYLSGVAAFIPGLSAYAVYFFYIGAYMAIGRHNPVDIARRLMKPAGAVALLTAAAMLLSYGTPVFSSLMLAFRLTGAVTLFGIASCILKRTRKRQASVIGDSTYFIFLVHYVFLLSPVDTLFLSILGTGTAGLTIHYLLCPLLKCAIYCAVYIGWHNLRVWLTR